MPAQMIAHERRVEIVAVVVTSLAAQGEGGCSLSHRRSSTILVEAAAASCRAGQPMGDAGESRTSRPDFGLPLALGDGRGNLLAEALQLGAAQLKRF